MAKTCRRCGWRIEYQVFYSGRYKYDIGEALAILKTHPRKPVVIPTPEAFVGVAECKVVQKHLPHVDISRPCIAVTIGRRAAIIDGNHRAWVRLFRKLPIRAYLLTANERDAIRTKA
jgi:hypothetical protein